MEEARLDHGLDRLPFFLLFTLLLTPLLAPPARATTFGPMTISNQVDTAPYFVRGRVVGGSWVEEERKSRRPYTYWKLAVSEQLKGNALGPELIMRQPGGELGEMGYHVAGTATFKESEDVFVSLRDTDEPAKEITGLASGKYTVERGANGEPQVRSGLGFIVKDVNGAPFRPDTFSAFVRKLATGKANDAERMVYLNKDVAHDHSPELERGLEEAKKLQKAHTESAPTPPPSTEKLSDSSVQNPPDLADEPSGSSSTGWLVGGAVALFAIAGFWFFRRR